MSYVNTTIIIGAGIAGVHAAENLRNEGYQDRIVLMDRDSQLPYDRPPLSKEWMKGEIDHARILLRDPAIYEELDIDLKLGVEVTGIDPQRKTLDTKDGSSYEWDKLILATGSSLRTLSITGDDLKGIFYLRKMDDAIAMKDYMQHVKQAVIIGAGFIGAELASTLSEIGIDVTIVERSSYPMENIVGQQASAYFLDLHRRNGVEVITEDAITQFNGEGKVEEAVTAGGRRIPCQAVVIGVGVTPNTEVSSPQLEEEGGYVVNAYGETSVSNIYAVGDCTSWPYQGYPIRIEHWDHAVNHAKTVAKNVIHPRSTPYTYTPYFWSDQYHIRFQYFGHAKNWSKTVLRGSIESDAFTIFYLNDQDIVKAAFISNQPKHALPTRRMIQQQKAIDTGDLADESIALKKVQRLQYK
ncbi:oxidoreductase [Virgibacillus sp. NKC19-3]|uniref:NAD(P)/FAD-dependent oxidoreductase n=1 Tax=Virgibacillus saliphilus TaxID=2831674 RepID=UPI001C9A2D79|nr:FAD-dependent oxidoreductase [Virgibacillus sp. NKC19-3]MBY7144392.1 oxidoreductase [Virgibacillus sp. NKC19-3]